MVEQRGGCTYTVASRGARRRRRSRRRSGLTGRGGGGVTVINLLSALGVWSSRGGVKGQRRADYAPATERR